VPKKRRPITLLIVSIIIDLVGLFVKVQLTCCIQQTFSMCRCLPLCFLSIFGCLFWFLFPLTVAWQSNGKTFNWTCDGEVVGSTPVGVLSSVYPWMCDYFADR